MSLREEALLTYDELEALFFQVTRDKNMSWFGTFASPSRQDDSAPLLSISKKPYRDLILANSISVFDFRIYLLARQCALLSSLSRIVEIGRKVVSFLHSFGRRLRELQVRDTCSSSAGILIVLNYRINLRLTSSSRGPTHQRSV